MQANEFYLFLNNYISDFSSENPDIEINNSTSDFNTENPAIEIKNTLLNGFKFKFHYSRFKYTLTSFIYF